MQHNAWLAAVAAIVVGIALQVIYMRRFEAEVSGGAPVAVLVAARDMAANDTLSADKLGVRNIPSAYIELRHVRQGDHAMLVGESLANAVRAGEALLWSDLRVDPTRAVELADRVRPGMRAVSLAASNDQGFGELLRAGDRVDVLLTSSAATLASAAWTDTLLQNVLVLAVGNDLSGPIAETRRTSRTAARQVTLSVTPLDSQRLAQARLQGNLTLTLRHPDDAVTDGTQRVHAADVITRLATPSAAGPHASAEHRASQDIEHVR